MNVHINLKILIQKLMHSFFTGIAGYSSLQEVLLSNTVGAK